MRKRYAKIPTEYGEATLVIDLPDESPVAKTKRYIEETARVLGEALAAAEVGTRAQEARRQLAQDLEVVRRAAERSGGAR